MRRILFIAGSWRSGSTLLGDLLGAIPGFHHAGELHHVWKRGLQFNWRCGCGELFRSCEFWRRIVSAWEAKCDLGRVIELERSRQTLAADRESEATPAFMRERYPEYAQAVGALAHAVFEVSGARTIVDSSKTNWQACALAANADLDVRTVHLVRDPRATVFSLVERPKRRLDDPKGSTMVHPDLERAIAMWISSNWQAEQLKEITRGYLLLRYEDLVAEPIASLERLAELAGEPSGSVAAHFLSSRAIRFPPSHTISGNPDRLRAESRTRIRLDDEWSVRMRPQMREAVEDRTRHWMWRYRYA